jgi:hypothetical protein
MDPYSARGTIKVSHCPLRHKAVEKDQGETHRLESQFDESRAQFPRHIKHLIVCDPVVLGPFTIEMF